MCRVKIRHKHVMVAREAARKDCKARETGRSVFIKRCYGSYRLISIIVSDKQRSCRDLFAEAQKLASLEMKQWNKKRHWARMAKRRGIKGAHRMAVSWFYGILKEGSMERYNHNMALSDTMFEVGYYSKHEMTRVGPRLEKTYSMLKWEQKSRMVAYTTKNTMHVPS